MSQNYELQRPDKFKSLFQVAKYLKPFWKQVVLGPLAKMTEAVIELLTPFVMSKLIDSIPYHQGEYGFFLKRGALLLLLVIVSFGFSFICQYMASVTSQGVGTNLRRDLFTKIQSLSFSQLDYYGSVSLSNRLTFDISNIQVAVAYFIRLFFRSPLLIIGSTVASLIIAPKLAIVFVPVIILAFTLLALIMRKTIPLQSKAQQKTDQLADLTNDNLTGVRIIRAFNNSGHERDHFHKHNNILNSILEKSGKLSALLTPGSNLIINIAVIVVLAIGGESIRLGSLTAGELIALINYLNLLLQGVTVFTNLMADVPKNLSSSQRVMEILKLDEELPQMSEAEIEVMDKKRFRSGDSKSAYEYSQELKLLNSSKMPKLLQVNALDYSYAKDAAPVLEDINFSLGSGQSLGIIGATGAGKSTLIELMQRFYEADFGQVYLKGKDIRSLSRKEISSKIAYVPQKPVLFSGTVRDNLLLGLDPESRKRDAGLDLDQELWQALEIAQAKDFVENKNGLETRVERGGRNFSGGQKQRLAIARALVKNVDLIIFDDSASALDFATESHLNKALASLENRPALIVISQRIRSIYKSEDIILLDKGRLVAQGKHDELMQKSELYREIYASQENLEEQANE